MPRRRFGLFLLALVLLVAPPARAQDYPWRPIRLIVSSPAGSLVDVLSHLLAQDVSARLGQSIVIDNRAGGVRVVYFRRDQEMVADHPGHGHCDSGLTNG
jgi:tripartite-type tricarboxylate transporter receptor subunit TctC